MSSNDKSNKNSPAPEPTSEFVAYGLTKCLVAQTASACFTVSMDTGLSMQLCVGLVLTHQCLAI